MNKCTESWQFILNQINWSIQTYWSLFFFKNIQFVDILVGSSFAFKISSLVGFYQDVLDVPTMDDEISGLYLTSSSYSLVVPSQYI